MNTPRFKVPAKIRTNLISQNEASSTSLLKLHIENGSKKMNKGESYRLKEIFSLTVEGRLYWKLNMGLHTSIGLIVAEMEENNLLPITFVGKTSCNKCLYKSLQF